MSEALVADPQATVRRQVLEYLPVGLFGSVMGLAGLGFAWRLAADRYGAPAAIGEALGWTAVAAFVVLAIAYGVKLATSPDAARAEFQHPIAGNLFGTFIISILLLPIVLAPLSMAFARGVWFVGVALMILFAWLVASRWVEKRQQPAHATPAWIVPVVGLLDVPLAMPALGLTDLHGLGLFALSVGLFFAVPLFTLILARLMFEEPLPAALRPSLLIVVAPFSVGFSSYVAVFGRIDAFAEALFLTGLFVLAVLLTRLRDLIGCCPFKVGWWAASFPLAATAVAGIRYADHAPSAFSDAIAIGLLALASVVIAGLAARTLWGVARGELRTLSA